MRHYLYLSVDHAARKYLSRAYATEELERGWHRRRAALRPEAIALLPESDLRESRSDDDLDPSSPLTVHPLRGIRVSTGLVLVAATIASFPGNGGIAWERLSWALGLRRLGWDVVLVDQLDPGPLRPQGRRPGLRGCLNLGWFERIVERFGLTGSAALIGSSGESLAGATVDEADRPRRDGPTSS